MGEFWSEKPPSSIGGLGGDRAHERYVWNHWVHVCWIRNSMFCHPVVVGTADLSAGGIGLICPHMVHSGSIGLVILVGAEQRIKLRYVEVVHCRYLTGSMSHLVGARWIPEPAGMPEVRAEMSSDGLRIVVGPPRSPVNARPKQRAAAIIGNEFRGPNVEGRS